MPLPEFGAALGGDPPGARGHRGRAAAVTPRRSVAAGRLPVERALALDEAVARSGGGPALLLWRTDPAVIVGRFQRVDWEVDAAACAARGVRVWRRFTGGGTVYLDAGDAVRRAVRSGRPPRRGRSAIPELYAPLLDGIAAALRRATWTRSATTARCASAGRKVTGIAAHRGRAGAMVHGTVLIDADLAALRATIAGPRGGDLEGRPRPSPSRPDHVANTGAGALEDALCTAFGAEPGELTGEEAELAERLAAERYADRGWHGGPWLDVTPPAVAAVLGGSDGRGPGADVRAAAPPGDAR